MFVILLLQLVLTQWLSINDVTELGGGGQWFCYDRFIIYKARQSKKGVKEISELRDVIYGWHLALSQKKTCYWLLNIQTSTLFINSLTLSLFFTFSMHYITQVYLFLICACKIGDFKIAGLVYLQKKVCLHSLLRRIFWLFFQLCIEN